MGELAVLSAFLAVAGMWGSSFLFIKLGLNEVGPFTLVTLRTGFAFVAVAALLLLRSRRIRQDRRTLFHLLIVGALNPAIPYALITWGQQFVTSAVAGIINATVPLFTLPIAHLALRDEAMNRTRVAGLGIGFLGVVLLFSPDLARELGHNAALSAGERGAPARLLGQLAMVAAAVCYAGSMVYVRHFLRQTPSEMVAGTSQGVAFLLTVLPALALESPVALPVSGAGWLIVAWLGISSGLSYLLFYFVLRRWGTTRTSLVTYLVPVIAVLLGGVVLDEAISWQSLLGGLSVISGIVIINHDARAPQAGPSTTAHSAQ